MHLDAEQVQRVLHGELDAAHVAECAECRARVAEAQREEETVFGLLRRLDHAAPAVSASTVVARARAAETWRRMRWAAGVLLALTIAGAAYAAPGSPLPGWVDRLVARLTGAAPDRVESGDAGIVVTPGARFTIAFAAEHPAGTLTVSLIDGADITVRRRNGTGSFTSDVDRLTIAAGESPAVYEIELPRNAPWVEIVVQGRRVLLKDGGRIVTQATPGAAGRYTLPLSP